eukprot:474409_1
MISKHFSKKLINLNSMEMAKTTTTTTTTTLNEADATKYSMINQISVNNMVYNKNELKRLSEMNDYSKIHTEIKNNSKHIRSSVWSILSKINTMTQSEFNTPNLYNAQHKHSLTQTQQNALKKLQDNNNNEDNKNEDEGFNFQVDYQQYYTPISLEYTHLIQNIILDVYNEMHSNDDGKNDKGTSDKLLSTIRNLTTKHKSGLINQNILPVEKAIHDEVVTKVLLLIFDNKLTDMDTVYNKVRNVVTNTVQNTFDLLWPNKKKEITPFGKISFEQFRKEQRFRIMMNELQWMNEVIDKIIKYEIENLNHETTMISID